MGRFLTATSVSLQSSNVFASEIHDGWDVMGNANGGYLMSLFGRAALLESQRRDLISVSAHFLSPGKPGPISAHTETLKSGKRFATTRIDLRNTERSILSGTVITGDLDDGDGPELTSTAPDIPSPLDCPRTFPEPTGTFPPAFLANVEQRVHPNDVPGISTEPRVRGWFRLLDDDPIDTVAVLMASDFLPPTVFNTDLPLGWVPTVQMTVHMRRRPQTEWLLVDSRTRFVQDGTFEIDADIYDDAGHLVAQSRQLLLIARA